MSKQTIQTIAIQKTLGLSKQDALKVLIFIIGMDAGKDLESLNDLERGEKMELIEELFNS